MRETRDLGIKWPQWHTLLFEGQVAVDMRVVCPQDAKKMLLKRARMVYWNKWAAKHECEELKEGVWLEPTKAVLQRQTHGAWQAPKCDEEAGLEGDWMLKRLYDIGCSDEKTCRMCYL